MYKIALIGGGGVGKSTLAYSFAGYLNKQGIRARVANLDPACRHLKYEPVFDLRKWYSLSREMREHKLGSSGALKKIYLSLEANKSALRALEGAGAESDWLLLDTVGSLELFLLEGVASFLRKTADAVLFIVDNEGVESESDFIVLKAINAVQCLKYALPTLTVVNKADLLEKSRRRESAREHRLAAEGGLEAVSENLVGLLREVGKNQRLVFVSAWERTGFKELMDSLHELKCECGE